MQGLTDWLGSGDLEKERAERALPIEAPDMEL